MHGKSHGSIESAASDLAESAAYNALQLPYDGVRQLVNRASVAAVGSDMLPEVNFILAPQEADFGTINWHSQQIGAAIGMAVPMFAMTKLAGARMFATEGTGIIANGGRAAVAGAAFDFAFRPTSGDNFWQQRIENAAVGGLTMASMAVSGSLLSRQHSLALRNTAAVPHLAYSLRHQTLNGIASGAAGGLVASEAHSLVQTGNFASASDLVKSAYGFAFTGATLGALHRAADRITEQKSFDIDTFAAKNQTLGRSDGIQSPMVDLLAVDLLRKTDMKGLWELEKSSTAYFTKAEHATAIAELRRLASTSRFGSERAIEGFVRFINKRDAHFKNANLIELHEKYQKANEALDSARAALSRAQKEAAAANNGFVMHDKRMETPSYKNAFETHSAATISRNQAEQLLKAEILVVEKNISTALNEYLLSQGLPPVKLSLRNDPDFGAYAFGKGEMTLGIGSLTSSGLSPKAAEVLLHEIVHYEQDIIRVRLMLDELGIGKNTTNDQMIDIARREHESVGGFTQEFVESVINHRNGKMLTLPQSLRAEQLGIQMRSPKDNPILMMEQSRRRLKAIQRELDSLDSGTAFALAHQYTHYQWGVELKAELTATELFGRQHSSVESILTRAKTAKDKPPKDWDEAAIKAIVKEALNREVSTAESETAKYYLDYVRQPFELEAYSVGLLTNLKARAMGFRPASIDAI